MLFTFANIKTSEIVKIEFQWREVSISKEFRVGERFTLATMIIANKQIG